MNNENQNFNNNTMGTNMNNPTPVPNPEPLPVNDLTHQNPTPMNQEINNLGQNTINNQQVGPIVTPTPQPENIIPNEQTGVVYNPTEIAEPILPTSPEIVSTPQINTFENSQINQVPNEYVQTPNNTINLQPEGTVQPAPVNEPTQMAPLTGTTLTSQTIMNPSPTATEVNSSVMGMPYQGMPTMNTIPPQVPNMDMMGGVPMPPTPPANNEKKAKKPNKTLLLVLIIVLICAVGFGVWYFLNTSKEKAPNASITPKLAQFELGQEIDLKDVGAFVTLTGISASNCTVESDLDPNKAGSYNYSVSCTNGLKSENNKVVVQDTTPPEVTLKKIDVAIGAAIVPEDLIYSIKDASECSAQFKESINTDEEGEIDVTIIVSDAYGNETEVIGTVNISKDAPQYYLYCESSHTSDEYPNTTLQKNYKYGINSMGVRYNAIQEISYTFENEEDYENAKENIMEDIFDGIEGSIRVDDDNLTITIETSLEDEELEKIFEISPFPDTEIGINDVHTAIGESCYIDN